MEQIMIRIILLIFPILMYLVFCCYNALANQKISKIIFILTIFTSLYFCLIYNIDNEYLLLFCNIPVLICYFKKEVFLGIIVSLIIFSYSIFKYDVNAYIVLIKYLSYFMAYLLLNRRKEFNYLYLKISAVIQGFFVSFEYFISNYNTINEVSLMALEVLVIYVITFFSLYLFKLANQISSLYLIVNKINEDSKIKDSLFKLTHEIKNPIAVCKGYLDMINLADKCKSEKYIRIIKSEIDRSLNVIADYMEYSKIKINKEMLDLGMLMDEIYESFSLLVKSKNIKYNYHNDYEEIYLCGDYDRLKQVFVNIIKNSIEAIEEHGIIDIDVKLDNKWAIITISDNGIGMDKEELKNIKEMFYTTKKNGTGLGVALSNEIILAHNGELIYDSIKNKGTKSIVKLPL